MSIPILSIYVALTDGQGEIPVRLELVDVDEELAPLFSDEQCVTFTDPCVVMEMGFQKGGIMVPQPGEYRLKLFANNEFIIERRLLVAGPSEEGE